MEAAAAAVAGEDWDGSGREAKKARAEPEPMQTDAGEEGRADDGGSEGRKRKKKKEKKNEEEKEGGGKVGAPLSSFAQFVSESDSSSSSSSGESSGDSDSEEDILAPLAENA